MYLNRTTAVSTPIFKYSATHPIYTKTSKQNRVIFFYFIKWWFFMWLTSIIAQGRPASYSIFLSQTVLFKGWNQPMGCHWPSDEPMGMWREAKLLLARAPPWWRLTENYKYSHPPFQALHSHQTPKSRLVRALITENLR